MVGERLKKCQSLASHVLWRRNQSIVLFFNNVFTEVKMNGVSDLLVLTRIPVASIR